MAVASQSPLARVQLSLQVAGLAGQFGDHIYVTSMVPRPKPAPDIYLLAAARLGVAPADCMVIEDSPAGAAAALGAGMRAIGYAPGDTFDAPCVRAAPGSSARWTNLISDPIATPEAAHHPELGDDLRALLRVGQRARGRRRGCRPGCGACRWRESRR